MSTTDIAIRDEASYLATVASVRELAMRIESVSEARDLADRARAAQVWAQRAKLGQEQVNLAATAKLWAERRAGELLIASRENGERAAGGPGFATESHRATLCDLGVTKHESSRWQKLAEASEVEFQDAIVAAADEGGVSTAAVMRRMDVHYSSATDAWGTPQELFDLLDEEFRFDLDVCASPENAKCAAYYSVDDDGLAKSWLGADCWMNPPYGSEIGKWVAKAYETAAEGGRIVCCLLPARVDTGWWWDYCRHGEVRFLRGRLRFGGGHTGAPFPSAVVIFGRPANVIWWERWHNA